MSNKTFAKIAFYKTWSPYSPGTCYRPFEILQLADQLVGMYGSGQFEHHCKVGEDEFDEFMKVTPETITIWSSFYNAISIKFHRVTTKFFSCQDTED